MIILLENFRKKLLYKIKSNPYYAWYITCTQRNKYLESLLQGIYCTNNKASYTLDDKYVICPFEGNLQAGGLADRIRGIIAVYAICKELNLNFRLYFAHPFKLQDYLMPNKYDWQIDKKDIVYEKPYTKVLILEITQDNKYQRKKQYEKIRNNLSKTFKQYHIYTNTSCFYGSRYSVLFKELFKLSPRLSAAIEKQKTHIGQTYISVSCRFLDLLGDFNETYGRYLCLADEEREEYILRNISQLNKLHVAYPNCKILVNSDSRTFLDRVKQLSFVYVNPGNITHIDNEYKDTCYETYEKTFVDFFMIANANKIFLLKTGMMHKSGYPYSASLIYNKPFEIIEY